jgi:hypothetical protein
MLITGVANLLLQQAAITSVIAGGNALQPIPAPVDQNSTDDQYPCITYQVVSDRALDRTTSNGATDTRECRIVFDCLASLNPGGYGIVQGLAQAIVTALDGYTGTLNDGTLVYTAEVVNVVDSFQNDAFLSCTAVHVMFVYRFGA